MKRYLTTAKKIDKSGKRVYSTTFYPDILISDDDVFITPKNGDRLDSLAYAYYGDSTLWWIIAKANGIVGQIALSTEDVIRIPNKIGKILQDFDNLNR